MLNDVTPLTIGILKNEEESRGFLASVFSKKTFTQAMDPYIKKNTAVPANKEKTVMVTEADKSLIILEGESELPQKNTILGEIPLNGIAAGDRIDVKMNINEDNILTVTYVNVKKGKTAQQRMHDK